jgi:hypothetical protein
MICVNLVICFSQPAILRDRNVATHNAMAAEMLHRAILGPAPTSNPEFSAFRKGVLLSCENGFRFSQVHCLFLLFISVLISV